MNSTARIAKRLLALLATVWTVSSCVVNDGPFEQASGKPIDPQVLSALERNKASIRDVIDALGSPVERRTNPGGTVLVYKSVRARTSKESVASVTVSGSTQEFTEIWELEFVDDKLIRTRTSNKVSERH